MSCFRNHLLALCLISGAHGFAHAPAWSLESTKSGWNSYSQTRLYFHNSEPQRQWAWELLGKHSFQGSERVLDVGCGDGKIIAEISRLVPEGTVVGADISAEMIHFAHIKFPAYTHPNLTFREVQTLDFSDELQQEKYDLICSFCVFHLVSQPVEMLKNMKGHLDKNGKLLLVIPAGKNPEFFQAAEETLKSFLWAVLKIGEQSP